MTHKPPLPDAAVAPYPAHPAPQAHVASKAPAPRPKPQSGGGAIGWLAAGAAIGSAALVAGLLLARRLETGGGKPAKPARKPARKKAAPKS